MKKTFLLLLTTLALFSCKKDDAIDCMNNTSSDYVLYGEVLTPTFTYCEDVTLDPNLTAVNKQIKDALKDSNTVYYYDSIPVLAKDFSDISTGCKSTAPLDVTVSFSTRVKNDDPTNVQLIAGLTGQNQFEIKVDESIYLDRMNVEAVSIDKPYMIQFSSNDGNVFYMPIYCDGDVQYSPAGALLKLKMIADRRKQEDQYGSKFKGVIKGGYIEDFQ